MFGTCCYFCARALRAAPPTLSDFFGIGMRSMQKMDTLGFEPSAFRMRSGCDTTTPCARLAFVRWMAH